MTRVLVTGANGFVGNALCRHLSEGGLIVRAALRSERVGPEYAREKIVVGEISSATNWDAALRDVDSVVHLAAHVHVMNPTTDDSLRFHETNVLGTRALCEAAARMRIRRFTYLSSIKVNGEQTQGIPFTGADPHNPMDEYGRSKSAAEKALFDVAAKSNMTAFAIRSPLVYGPGVKANFLKLMSWV
jgi:nucleoside-diphosphate-sugar epimerase